jgi:hypothetical protein
MAFLAPLGIALAGGAAGALGGRAANKISDLIGLQKGGRVVGKKPILLHSGEMIVAPGMARKMRRAGGNKKVGRPKKAGRPRKRR